MKIHEYWTTWSRENRYYSKKCDTKQECIKKINVLLEKGAEYIYYREQDYENNDHKAKITITKTIWISNKTQLNLL